MKLVKTNLKGLFIIKTKIHKDNRGYLKEVYKFNLIKKKFIFDIYSYSKKNILRGLHFQINKPQDKFLTVTKGKIFDVVVDLRKNSKTFGKSFSKIISDKDNFSLYIPKNFAHGFLCLSKECSVYYKCSEYRKKNFEKTLLWNDISLNIKWPCKKPILSNKDLNGITYEKLKKLIGNK